MRICNIVKNGLGQIVIMDKLPEDFVTEGFMENFKSSKQKIKCRYCGLVLTSLRTDTYGVEALIQLVYHINENHSGEKWNKK